METAAKKIIEKHLNLFEDNMAGVYQHFAADISRTSTLFLRGVFVENVPYILMDKGVFFAGIHTSPQRYLESNNLHPSTSLSLSTNWAVIRALIDDIPWGLKYYWLNILLDSIVNYYWFIPKWLLTAIGCYWLYIIVHIVRFDLIIMIGILQIPQFINWNATKILGPCPFSQIALSVKRIFSPNVSGT